MTSRPSIFARLRKRFSEAARRRRFNAEIEHVHGDGFSVPEGEVLAIVLVRDGSYYLDAFLAYYRSLGIRHFAFLDNGSTDDTIERIRSEQGCVIDRAVLPLAQYEDLMRAYPAQTYGRNRWCLYVDMDEQFDFEGRDTHGLSALIRYMEKRGHTALLAQMLEMFPRAPLTDVAKLTYAQALTAFVQYDLSTVDSFAYHSDRITFAALLSDNTLADEGAMFKFGGVRKKVFDEACCLTKHPLVFNGVGVVPAPHPHLSKGVYVSDIQGVIRHYKFAGNVVARDAQTSASGDVAHGEDAARLKLMQSTENLTLHSADAQVWRGVAPLYEAGFLRHSVEFTAALKESRT